MKRLPSMKQLQYLVALADTRHFGRAANKCFITQSTLSAGIRDLEAVLGTKVAERTKRYVMLTRVGEQIADRARELLRDADEVMELAKASRAPMTGDMRLGVIPTISPFLLPTVLPVLRRRFPHLKLYLREEQTLPLLSQLEDGELDVAVIALPYDTRALRTEVIFDDELLFACDRKHEFAKAHGVPVESLEEDQLMLMEEGHCLRDHALTACSSQEGQVMSQYEASSLHTLVQMVAAGIGVALIPKLAVDARITRGAAIATSQLIPPAARQIGLAWRATSLRQDDFQTLAMTIRELKTAT